VTVNELLAIVAGITAPACAFLSYLVRVLYADLKEARAENVALLRETLEALQSLEVTDED